MKFIALVFGLTILLSSCVTNKKYVYLQHDDVNSLPNHLVKDTVVREYRIRPYVYKIQPNDLISVQFESLTDKEYDFLGSLSLQGGAGGNANQGNNALLIGELVDDQGDILFPFVGRVKVVGLSVFEIQDKLQGIANQYLEAPAVKVRLLNFRITFLGEVNKEGTINLINNRSSIMEAIGMAGGLTDLADKSNIKLIRQTGDKTEIVYLNLLDEDFIKSPYYYVHQNDILIAGALRQRPYRKYFAQNLALFVSTATLALLVYNISQTNKD
jgi:polysaccharide biosynthesis/export protein